MGCAPSVAASSRESDSTATGNHVTMLFNLGVNDHDRGHLNSALQYFENTLRVCNGDHLDSLIRIATINFELKNYNEALKQMGTVIMRDESYLPQYAYHVNALPRTKLLEGDIMHEVMETYRHASAPTFLEFAMALNAMAHSDYTQAESLLERALKSATDPATCTGFSQSGLKVEEVKYQLALLYSHKQDDLAALELLQEAVPALSETFSRAILGFKQAQCGRADQGLENLHRALRSVDKVLLPGTSDQHVRRAAEKRYRIIHAVLGQVYDMEGDRENAVKHYQTVQTHILSDLRVKAVLSSYDTSREPHKIAIDPIELELWHFLVSDDDDDNTELSDIPTTASCWMSDDGSDVTSPVDTPRQNTKRTADTAPHRPKPPSSRKPSGPRRYSVGSSSSGSVLPSPSSSEMSPARSFDGIRLFTSDMSASTECSAVSGLLCGSCCHVRPFGMTTPFKEDASLEFDVLLYSAVSHNLSLLSDGKRTFRNKVRFAIDDASSTSSSRPSISSSDNHSGCESRQISILQWQGFHIIMAKIYEARARFLRRSHSPSDVSSILKLEQKIVSHNVAAMVLVPDEVNAQRVVKAVRDMEPMGKLKEHCLDTLLTSFRCPWRVSISAYVLMRLGFENDAFLRAKSNVMAAQRESAASSLLYSYKVMAEVYESRNDPECGTYYQKVLQCNPACTASQLGMARLHAASDPTKALSYFKSAVDNGAALDVRDYVAYGTVLRGAGKHEKAIEMLRMGLEKRGSDPAVLCELGKTYALSNRLSEAAGCFKEYITLNHDSPDGYQLLGAVYLKQNHPHEAIAQYRKALDCDPDYTDAQVGLNIAYSKLEA